MKFKSKCSNFLTKKLHKLIMSSVKWWHFCLGCNVLIKCPKDHWHKKVIKCWPWLISSKPSGYDFSTTLRKYCIFHDAYSIKSTIPAGFSLYLTQMLSSRKMCVVIFDLDLYQVLWSWLWQNNPAKMLCLLGTLPSLLCNIYSSESILKCDTNKL